MASFYVNLAGQTDREALENIEVTWGTAKGHYRRLLKSTRRGSQSEHWGFIYIENALRDYEKKQIQHAISGDLCVVCHGCFL